VRDVASFFLKFGLLRNGFKMYRIFYCCYSTGLQASDEEMVEVKTKEKLLDFAMDVLREPEDFFGIVDSEEKTLQFCVEESDELWVEIPSLEKEGSFGKIIAISEFSNVVDLFMSKRTIPGLVFTSWS